MGAFEPRAGMFYSQRYAIYSILLSIMGVGVASYSIYHHQLVKLQGASGLSCNISGSISCDAVAASPYSEFLGFPLGIWGLGYFAVLFVTGLLLLRRRSSSGMLALYVQLAGAGVLCSVVLASLSGFVVQALCVVCLGIYVICFLQGLLALRWWLRGGRGWLVPGVRDLWWSPLLMSLFLISYSYKSAAVVEDQEASVSSSPTKLLLGKKQEFDLSFSPYLGFGEDYHRGDEEAPVVIVKFSDFQCPACRRMGQILEEVKKEYGDQVALVYKNYPLDKACNPDMAHAMHPAACKAAILARCAGQGGNFWEYYDAVFGGQAQIMQKGFLENIGKSVGLSPAQMDACLQSKDIRKKIGDDVALARKLGVRATPTLYVNGRKFNGSTFAELRTAVDQLILRR